MYILGVSGLYHDSAACVIKDGDIIAAAQEERFTRIKNDNRLPIAAIKFCMNQAGIMEDELEAVVYYDQPILTLNRFVSNVAALGSEAEDLIDFNYKKMVGEKLWIHKELRKLLGGLGRYDKLLVTKHHIAHAASAFYPSPFDKAVVLTIDGVGEWTTTAIGVGDGDKIKLCREMRYPHSLGLLYSAFTYFCGFKVNSGDYKFMGLAPYGKPVYYNLIKDKIIDIKDDGSFRLDLEYFDFHKGRSMINEEKFHGLFGRPRRNPESRITSSDMDIASSVQKITEEIILSLVRYAKKEVGHGISNLAMAGGVGLNCVANGKIEREKIFDNIWIQPAAGDAGGALGAALYAYYTKFNNRRIVNKTDSQQGSFLGPCYGNEDILKFLREENCTFYFYDDEELFRRIAELLASEKVIGLFQGRMEFGPRALGHRSIIADCRSADMQSKINLKIKYRESFRPFAPIVLAEDAENYFKIRLNSPYMLKTSEVVDSRKIKFDLGELLEINNGDMLKVVSKPRSDIPAVTHVDYSARVQTVDTNRNPRLYKIMSEFKQLTGCSVLVNTSFNVRGEPIVCTPYDAYNCFMNTEMDVLVLENYILYKSEQCKKIDADWKNKYEPD